MKTEPVAGETGVSPLRMTGLPVLLDAYPAPQVRKNRHFDGAPTTDMDRFYLPESMRPFTEASPVRSRTLLADDNRSAVSAKPYVDVDGTEFYLSAKGIGSTTDPFSRYPLSKSAVSSVLGDPMHGDPALRKKVIDSRETSPRYITAELWQRFSPYGGQGLEHAEYSMRAAEFDDVTSIHGFRICPLVNIVYLPEELEQNIKKLFWYRQFRGRMVQELRLVPSNVRVYFHSGTTIGETIGSVFDYFGIDTNEKALDFVRNYLKSGIPYLSLFVRSMRAEDDGTYSGLDFYDVWMDKDATVAKDGTVYFADLEGLNWVKSPPRGGPAVWDVSEMVNHQFFRQLYEFQYAYDQMERERSRRFGPMASRKTQYELMLREALKNDEVAEVYKDGDRLMIRLSNILGERKFVESFPALDGAGA